MVVLLHSVVFLGVGNGAVRQPSSASANQLLEALWLYVEEVKWWALQDSNL